MSTSYTLMSCSITARSPSPASVVGRSLGSGTPATPQLRAMNASRFVSIRKCRISSSPACGETHRRRNHTHNRSIVSCAENDHGSSTLTTRISHTATRDMTLAGG